MNHGGDVFAVLGWGLRRYAVLVVACVLAVGVAVPAALERAPEQYEAQAQVGPSQALTLSKLDALPRLGETVFNNGAVAAAVRGAFDPALDPGDPVIPKRVDLIAAQDNIVFTVVGRGPSPRSAQRVANIAADRFSGEMNKYSQTVGAFAVTKLATPPVEPLKRASGTLTLGLGLLAGLAAGVGLVALLLVWHRPVIDAASAESATGVPVLGRVLLGRSAATTRGLPQLCRRVLAGSVDIVLLAGPWATRRDRRLLSKVLTEVLGWSRTVVSVSGKDPSSRSARPAPKEPHGRRRLVLVTDPSQAEIASRPETSMTLLVVPEGISQSALRHQAEQYLDGGPEGVVLVRRSHLLGWPGRGRTSRDRTAAPPGRALARPPQTGWAHSPQSGGAGKATARPAVGDR